MALPNCRYSTYWVSLFSSYWKSKTCSFTYIESPSIFLYTTTFFSTLFFGTLGVWLAFPLADLLATIVTVYFLNKAIRKELM